MNRKEREDSMDRKTLELLAKTVVHAALLKHGLKRMANGLEEKHETIPVL